MGHLKRKAEADLKCQQAVGKKFSRLLAVEFIGASEATKNLRMFKCVCDCGKVITKPVHTIFAGTTRSCGCLRRDTFKRDGWGKSSVKHGYASDYNLAREYICWSSMKSRCNNPKDISYKNYGAKGIEVCQRWEESFKNFIDDMGNKPSAKHSIDRIDPSKGYYKENCRWADKYQQANNRKNNLFFEINGERKTLVEWCMVFDKNPPTIYSRIKNGMNFIDAINKPMKHNFSHYRNKN